MLVNLIYVLLIIAFVCLAVVGLRSERERAAKRVALEKHARTSFSAKSVK
jgi:flagellar biogenesis protein FliO